MTFLSSSSNCFDGGGGGGGGVHGDDDVAGGGGGGGGGVVVVVVLPITSLPHRSNAPYIDGMAGPVAPRLHIIKEQRPVMYCKHKPVRYVNKFLHLQMGFCVSALLYDVAGYIKCCVHIST